MTTRNAIPTIYGGIKFRSRLEARWSFMFDKLGWRWEYEPIDLSGYIPDFILRFPAGPVLVEIKPALTVADLIRSAAKKIDQSGWESPNPNSALILGATWHPDGEAGYFETCGALKQEFDKDGGSWGEALWHLCDECSGVSAHHYLLGWQCTICGAGDGDRYLREPPSLEAIWRQAGNAVRWDGRRAA